MHAQIPIIRIFISSPGDVNDERKIALDVVEQFPYRPVFREKVAFRVVAWDKPGADTAMRATLTPQEAINQGLPKPSECDILIVLLWSRMGTPFKDTDNKEYLSGTHWELLDGLDSERTETLIYRRNEEKLFRVDEKDKIDQYERVETFFQSNLFYREDGSILRGVNQYETPEDFRRAFTNHLEELIVKFLGGIDNNIIIPAEELTPSKVDGQNVRGIQAVEWNSDQSPFPGLRSFNEEDASIFFGRGRETDALIKQVTESPFVAVVGASGSGKSSLVGAGLIPRLRERAIEGSHTWDIVNFTPGEQIFKSLAGALMEMIPSLEAQSDRTFARELDEFAEDLEGGIDRLRNTLHRILKDAPEYKKIVLFIDQFEELFTLTSPTLREKFIATLVDVIEQGRVQVVVTLRADFYHRAMVYSELAELLNDGNFNLIAPRRDALRDMIEYPADRAGLEIESGLIETILDDTGDEPGNLALMAYLLDELYRNCKDNGNLTHEAYDKLGGVDGAIGERAETVFNKIKESEKDKIHVIQSIFPELVDVNDYGNATRRRFDYDPTSESELVQLMLDELVNARLLTSDSGVLEVAHEALLREWTRLAEWIEREQGNLRLRRRILNDANNWNNDPSALYRGERLEEAQNFLVHNPRIDLLAIEFIDEAKEAEDIREKQRRRLFKGAALFSLAFILMTGSAFGLLGQSRQAIQNLDLASTEIVLAEIANTESAQLRNDTQNFVDSIQLAIHAQEAFNAGQVYRRDEAPFGLRLALEASYIAAPPRTQRILSEIAFSSGIRQIIEVSLTQITRIALNDDGSYALTGMDTGEIHIWSMESGEIVNTISGHDAPVTELIFLPSNTQFVSGSADGTVILWDSNTLEIVSHYEGQNNSIADLKYNTNNNQVISLTIDGAVIIWDFDTTEIVRQTDAIINQDFNGLYRDDLYKTLTISHDGTMIFNAGRIYDAVTGDVLQSYEAFPNLQRAGFGVSVNSNAVSRDDSYMLVGTCSDKYRTTCDAGGVVMWNVNGSLIRTFEGHPNYVTDVIFNLRHAQVISASAGDYFGTSIIVWDSQSNRTQNASGLIREYFGHSTTLQDMALSGDGKQLLSAACVDISCKSYEMILWDIVQGDIVQDYELPASVPLSAAFSPDATSLLLGTAGYEQDGSYRGDMLLYDVEDGTLLREFQPRWGDISSIEFSPNGTKIMTGAKPLIWDAETGEILHELKGLTGAVKDIAFSPDGSTVLGVTGFDLILWDVETGDILRHLLAPPPPSGFTSVAFSPDGRYALTGTKDGRALLWNLSASSIMNEYVSYSEVVTSVAFSPDGSLILLGTDAFHSVLINRDNGHVRQLVGHSNSVADVAFSPDGQHIVTASLDNTIILWQTSTGEIVRQYVGHTNNVTNILFSPQGDSILSTSSDQTVVLWRHDTPEQLQNWVINNRYLAELDCIQASTYSIMTCVGDESLPIPSLNPTSTLSPLPTDISTTFTPIASLTSTPTLIPTHTPTPTATPETVGIALLGEHSGVMPIGGGQRWSYNGIPNDEIQIIAHSLENYYVDLSIYDSSGNRIGHDDGGYQGFRFMSGIDHLAIPADGQIFIEVRTTYYQGGGTYTLTIEQAPTPTP